MKRIIRYVILPAIIGLVLCAALASCVKLWEEEWTECLPIPETEITISPDPWEPGEMQEEYSGD
jgi:hypothetical protein